MAEFCKECFLKIDRVQENEEIIMSADDDLDLCEGCGKFKPVVVEIKKKKRWLLF